jgi:hypothetical protein
MRDHSVEIMLVGGPNRLNRSPVAKVGIEEQGTPVDGDWYQFRLLDPLKVPKSGREASIAAQINKSYDSCRMFTNELKIVVGHKAILNHARLCQETPENALKCLAACPQRVRRTVR